MTNILLINVHSSRNIGDDALTMVTIQQLKENFPDCRLTIAMDDPNQSIENEQIIGSFFHWVKPTGSAGNSRWRPARLIGLLPATLVPLLSWKIIGKPWWFFSPDVLRPFVRNLIHSDLVVSTAGGFLYSSGAGLVFLISTYTLIFPILAGKPLYFFPQSYGPLRRFWERFLLKWVFQRARIIMAREEISFRLVNSLINNSNKAYLLPDPAFTLHPSTPKSAQNWLVEHGVDLTSRGPLLGITIVNWNEENSRFDSQDNYEHAIASAARYFIEHVNGKVVLFTQVMGPSYSQDDRVPTRRVAAQLNDFAEHVIHIQDVPAPPLLKSIYGLMDIFIGSRMHSNIFALSQGIPVIAIAYQPKTWGIMQMLNLEYWTIDISNVSENNLQELMIQLWDKKEEVRAQITNAISRFIVEANRPGIIVSEDYQKYLRNYDR